MAIMNENHINSFIGENEIEYERERESERETMKQAKRQKSNNR